MLGRPTLLLAALLTAWCVAAPTRGQAFFLPAAAPADNAAGLQPPRLKTPGARARRALAQFDALVESPVDASVESPAPGGDPGAGKDAEPIDWDEALALIEELIADDDGVVIAAAEPGRYVSLREHCHAKIAALPAEGLRAYRDRVDAAARRLFDEGRRRRDRATLRRVADEYFCSSWGDDALLLLGDLALEQGDTLTARRCWRRVRREASDPLGRPLAWSLRGVDLSKRSAEAKRIITEAESATLVCPGSDVTAGAVLARLALAALYDGDRETASTYATLLRLLAPEESGVLAGRSGAFATIIDGLVEASALWQGVAPAPIGPLAGRLWTEPFSRQPEPPPKKPNVQVLVFGNQLRPNQPQPAQPPAARCLPTVAGRTLVYRHGQTLRAVDLLSGTPAFGPKGVLHAPGQTAARNAKQNLPAVRELAIMSRLVSRAMTLPADEPMVVADGRLLARVTSTIPGRPVSLSAIRSFDLEREGLESPLIEPVDAPWRLGGAPLADKTAVYLPLVDEQGASQLALAAFSLTTGRELWRTPIATSQTGASTTPAGPPTAGVTRSGQNLLVNTNLGAVVALDKQSGRKLWVRLYDRAPRGSDRGGSACVAARGRVFVAPTDCASVFALDAATGRLLWTTPAAEGAFHLLGVAGDTLVVGGDQLRGLDTNTGAPRYTWPESRKAGLRGFGRGCLVAGEAFWPTRDRVLVFDAQRGSQTRPPLDTADLGGAGVNLVPAGELLVAAGVKAMTVFGPVDREQKSDQPQLSLTEEEPRMNADSRRFGERKTGTLILANRR